MSVLERLSVRPTGNRGLTGGDKLRAMADEWMTTIGDGPCWIWPSFERKPKSRAAQIMIDGHNVSAHRAMFKLLIGAVGRGLVLHHECLDRRCVNPHHLKPVTPAEHNRIHRILRRQS